jgi:hypothetical protein
LTVFPGSDRLGRFAGGPHASAIDTPLPKPPEHVRIMLDSAAPWAESPSGENQRLFSGGPEESLEEWHRRHRLP